MFFLCRLVRPPLVGQVCTTRPFPFKVSWLIGCKLGAMVGILLPTSRPLLYRNVVNALRTHRSLLLIFCCKALTVEKKKMNDIHATRTLTESFIDSYFTVERGVDGEKSFSWQVFMKSPVVVWLREIS